MFLLYVLFSLLNPFSIFIFPQKIDTIKMKFEARLRKLFNDNQLNISD